MNRKDTLPNLAPEIPLIGAASPVLVVPAKFKVGEVVVLLSGGPKMTVAQDTGDGRTECCYFETSKGVYQASIMFHEMLKLAE